VMVHAIDSAAGRNVRHYIAKDITPAKLLAVGIVLI